MAASTLFQTQSTRPTDGCVNNLPMASASPDLHPFNQIQVRNPSLCPCLDTAALSCREFTCRFPTSLIVYRRTLGFTARGMSWNV